jgi:hypothetical protein
MAVWSPWISNFKIISKIRGTDSNKIDFLSEYRWCAHISLTSLIIRSILFVVEFLPSHSGNLGKGRLPEAKVAGAIVPIIPRFDNRDQS